MHKQRMAQIALDFALRQGDSVVPALLREAGAKEGQYSGPTPVLKPKPAVSA